MLSIAASILIDGLAYGMVLFMASVGLTVTLGLMRFVNLAHGMFAVIGGYAAASLMTGLGVPYLLALGLAGLISAAVALGLEQLLVRHMYGRSELDQVLFTIGLVFVGIAVAGLTFGNSLVPVPLPEILRGATDLGFRAIPTHRLFAIAAGLVAVMAIWWIFERTRFGISLRATVDHQGAASGLGINTRLIYALAFALGAGLAGIGGAVGAALMPIEPVYPLKYLVLFLAVVAVGGPGSLAGSFVAAILLGTIETAGKYLAPGLASFALYLTMMLVLSWRPDGLFSRRTRT